MPAPKKDLAAAPATFAYAAPFPYYMRVQKKGRRTLESTLVKGIHHGEMPVAEPGAAKPVFTVVHGNGTRNDIVGWNGGLWAELRDLEGRPMTPAKFAEMLAGRGVESRGVMPTIHVFDPFSSPLNWKDGEPWNAALVGGHISGNPESPRDSSGKIEFDGEAPARARAARIAERLAVVDGSVRLRIPGPMWQVSDPVGSAKERRRNPDMPKAAVGAEWRIPMRPIDSDFRQRYSVADHRPGPIMAGARFYAWNRRDDALAEAKGIDRDAAVAGDIEVLDEALAAELCDPGAAFAASCAGELMSMVEAASIQIMQMSDYAVAQWVEARAAARELAEIWFGDVETARRGMRAMDNVVAEFEQIARGTSTSANIVLAACLPSIRRWREIEKPAMLADAGLDRDEAALAALKP